MNVEASDHTVPVSSEDQARPLRKVRRPLNPEEAVQKSQINEEKEGSIVFFRLKRTAEYEPSDILAIDGMNVPLISKKHQAKHLRDLEDEINKLDINKTKQVNEEMKENENKLDNVAEKLEGLLFFEDSQMDMKFVLKRVDPKNIYDLEKNEEDFRKNYKTMYNDINTKQKRDNILNQRRKNLLEKPTEEDGEKKKDARKIKVYDINLKEEFKQNVLFCNDSPMVVTNLLEIATKKNNFEEEVDDGYAYYAFRKVHKNAATGARAVTLHKSAKGIISSHLAEEDEQEFVHEGQDKDSDYEYKQDVDNHDSNAEDNSENEYPDEEEVEGSHSRDPWSDSDKYGNNNYDDEDEDDFDQNNQDDDEEEDEDIMFKDKKYHENQFKSNFWSKIKDMSKEDAE